MSKKWNAADLPDLSGRTIVITGASSGLGAATSREMAKAGATVVMAVRDVSKGKAVASMIPGETDVRRLDLSSLASIHNFAASWKGDIDILINNAGIMHAPQGRTSDGFELHIGTNHLGHFALTNMLLAHVTDRVVNVTSKLAARGKLDLDDLNWDKRRYRSSQAYSDSKQANTLFTLELQDRLVKAANRIRVMSAHPGIARTNLISQAGGVSATINKMVVGLVAQDPEHGIVPILFAATQDLPGGSFVGPNGFGHLRGYPELGTAPKSSQDSQVAGRLWTLSTRLTGAAPTVPGTQPRAG